MKNRTKKVYRRYLRLAKHNLKGGKKSRIKKAGEAIKETGEAVSHSNLVGVAVDPLKTLGKGLVGHNKKSLKKSLVGKAGKVLKSITYGTPKEIAKGFSKTMRENNIERKKKKKNNLANNIKNKKAQINQSKSFGITKYTKKKLLNAKSLYRRKKLDVGIGKNKLRGVATIAAPITTALKVAEGTVSLASKTIETVGKTGFEAVKGVSRLGVDTVKAVAILTGMRALSRKTKKKFGRSRFASRFGKGVSEYKRINEMMPQMIFDGPLEEEISEGKLGKVKLDTDTKLGVLVKGTREIGKGVKKGIKKGVKSVKKIPGMKKLGKTLKKTGKSLTLGDKHTRKVKNFSREKEKNVKSFLKDKKERKRILDSLRNQKILNLQDISIFDDFTEQVVKQKFNFKRVRIGDVELQTTLQRKIASELNNLNKELDEKDDERENKKCYDNPNFKTLITDDRNLLKLKLGEKNLKNCEWIKQDLKRCNKVGALIDDELSDKNLNIDIYNKLKKEKPVKAYDACRDTCDITCSSDEKKKELCVNDEDWKTIDDQNCDWVSEDINRCDEEGASIEGKVLDLKDSTNKKPKDIYRKIKKIKAKEACKLSCDKSCRFDEEIQKEYNEEKEQKEINCDNDENWEINDGKTKKNCKQWVGPDARGELEKAGQNSESIDSIILNRCNDEKNWMRMKKKGKGSIGKKTAKEACKKYCDPRCDGRNQEGGSSKEKPKEEESKEEEEKEEKLKSAKLLDILEKELVVYHYLLITTVFTRLSKVYDQAKKQKNEEYANKVLSEVDNIVENLFFDFLNKLRKIIELTMYKFVITEKGFDNLSFLKEKSFVPSKFAKKFLALMNIYDTIIVKGMDFEKMENELSFSLFGDLKENELKDPDLFNNIIKDTKEVFKSMIKAKTVEEFEKTPENEKFKKLCKTFEIDGLVESMLKLNKKKDILIVLKLKDTQIGDAQVDTVSCIGYNDEEKVGLRLILKDNFKSSLKELGAKSGSYDAKIQELQNQLKDNKLSTDKKKDLESKYRQEIKKKNEDPLNKFKELLSEEVFNKLLNGKEKEKVDQNKNFVEELRRVLNTKKDEKDKNKIITEVVDKLSNLRIKACMDKKKDNKAKGKCFGKTGADLRKCQMDYDKKIFDYKMGRNSLNTSMEKIFRLYLGIYFEELDPKTNWSMAQIGTKATPWGVEKETRRNKEILNKLVELHPDFELDKATLESGKEDEGYELIQKAINNYVRNKSYKAEVEKMTMLEHFIFVLCTKREIFSGRVKASTRKKTSKQMKNEGKAELYKEKKTKSKSKLNMLREGNISKIDSPEQSRKKIENKKGGGLGSIIGKGAMRAKRSMGRGLSGIGTGMKRELLGKKSLKQFELSDNEKEDIEKITKEDPSAQEFMFDGPGRISRGLSAIDSSTKGIVKGSKFVGRKLGSMQKKLSKKGKKLMGFNCNDYAKEKCKNDKDFKKCLKTKKKECESKTGFQEEGPKKEKRPNCLQDRNKMNDTERKQCPEGAKMCFEKKIAAVMTKPCACIQCVCCRKIKNLAKRAACEEMKQQIKDKNKDNCTKLVDTLEQLTCYKDQYDNTGKEKYRGMVKFLCRRNHCAKGNEDDICMELNACRNLRPRFRDVWRDSKQLYKELKGMLEIADVGKIFSGFKMPGMGGIGAAIGKVGFSLKNLKGSEYKKITQKIIKHLKNKKKTYKKQYKIFKKTEDGKLFSQAKKQMKKTKEKAKKSSKEDRKMMKFKSETDKEQYIEKIKGNQDNMKESVENMKRLRDGRCNKDTPTTVKGKKGAEVSISYNPEKCRLITDALKFKEIDETIAILKFAQKEGYKAKKKAATEKGRMAGEATSAALKGKKLAT